MFKKFLQKIIESENQDAAWRNVFYGVDGIDMAFQNGKISWKDYIMLCAIIEKMA